ncbi:hypothetical protein KBA73_04305 [Patescibacteria group bacterium]|nr:hypothetical protein [Patescibacteria group bacterium]
MSLFDENPEIPLEEMLAVVNLRRILYRGLYQRTPFDPVTRTRSFEAVHWPLEIVLETLKAANIVPTQDMSSNLYPLSIFWQLVSHCRWMDYDCLTPWTKESTAKDALRYRFTLLAELDKIEIEMPRAALPEAHPLRIRRVIEPFQALGCLRVNAQRRGEEWFFPNPKRDLTMRFGDLYDADKSIDHLIELDLAEWRLFSNLGTQTERLFLIGSFAPELREEMSVTDLPMPEEASPTTPSIPVAEDLEASLRHAEELERSALTLRTEAERLESRARRVREALHTLRIARAELEACLQSLAFTTSSNGDGTP